MVQRRLRQAEHAARIRADITAQTAGLPRQHDRDAVITDRPADQDPVSVADIKHIHSPVVAHDV